MASPSKSQLSDICDPPMHLIFMKNSFFLKYQQRKNAVFAILFILLKQTKMEILQINYFSISFKIYNDIENIIYGIHKEDDL